MHHDVDITVIDYCEDSDTFVCLLTNVEDGSNFIEDLLSNGFARCNQTSLLTLSPNKIKNLRQKQEEAQIMKLRIWAKTQKKKKKKTKDFTAIVTNVFSGDSIIV